MSDKVCMRKVIAEDVFCFQRNPYRIEGGGCSEMMVYVLYDSKTGLAESVRGTDLKERDVYPMFKVRREKR